MTMNQAGAKQAKAPRPFTGWHMLGVMVLFFGTIITVNVIMAWNASHSWSGLVVQNTYVASQQFNGKVKEAKAFAASGLDGKLAIESGALRYTLTRQGKPELTADKVVAMLKRPVEEHEDMTVEMAHQGEGVFVAAATLKRGQWIADITATKGDTVVYRQAIRFMVPGETP
ncbi:FixH family protein [Ensifer sp. B1-9]|uniref:FixH family protein n=1 Tax=Ensifer sp. B1-9 TaxID=3141455 RepID=UPI003D1D13AF